MVPAQLKMMAVTSLPELKPGDDLTDLLLKALTTDALALLENDILVVAQKIVSKSEGRLLDLNRVVVSQIAEQWASRYGKDARLVQVVLDEAKRIVRMDQGRLIVETRGGLVCANAGVDASNVPRNMVSLLPVDSDRSASELRLGIQRRTGISPGIIISDTFGRPWRIGQANVALGVAGLPSLCDYRGKLDSVGRPLVATQIAVADELASAAELLMGKNRGIPVVLIRGLQFGVNSGRGSDLIRASERDLFR